MAENGPSKINLEDFIGYFEQFSPVPDASDEPFILDYVTERIEGKADPQKYDEGSFEFSCVVTTKRILRHAIEAKVLHADSTYKLNWMGYPVHVFGTSDRAKKFHLIALGFSTRENTEQFKFCFESIKNGVLELFEHNLEWQCLMSDGALAIKNGFEEVWPNAVKLTCWFHVKEAIRKRAFQTARNKEQVLKDLNVLHLCPNVKVFDIASALFIKKWSKNEKDFATYFQNQWLTPVNKYWFGGAMDFAPCTNNCLESTNGKIKNNFNFRKRSKMNVFKIKIMEVVRVMSTEYRDGIKNIRWDVSISRDIWQLGYDWAHSKKEVIDDGDDPKQYYAPADTANKVTETDLNSYNNMTWKTFEQFAKNIFKVSVVSIPINKENFKSSTCTCPTFLKEYICKHIVGMGLRQQKINPPDHIKKLETKPSKRGRPKHAGPALALD